MRQGGSRGGGGVVWCGAVWSGVLGCVALGSGLGLGLCVCGGESETFRVYLADAADQTEFRLKS